MALADPVYLAIAGDAAIRKAITSGVRGSAMPAFAQTAGGMLTDKQIDVIASQIRSRWSGRGVFDRATPPAYAANRRATRSEANWPTKHIAKPATARAAAAGRRAAPSRMKHFLHW